MSKKKKPFQLSYYCEKKEDIVKVGFNDLAEAMKQQQRIRKRINRHVDLIFN